ncbi:MAG: hypothetical protein Q7J48_12105 [Nocardioides sp.]|nr:hypothetical protein [Nocardioides sp.]
MSRLRPLLACVLVGCLGALAGCADDKPDRAEEPELSSSFGLAPPPAELRMVLATSLEPPPDSLVKQQFDDLDCGAPSETVKIKEPVAACDAEGVKYSLEPSVTLADVDSASASEDSGAWVVSLGLDLDDDARRTLENLTVGAATTHLQVAVMRDGRVLAAPEVETLIAGGRFQVSGDFTEAQAVAFADRLSEG